MEVRPEHRRGAVVDAGDLKVLPVGADAADAERVGDVDVAAFGRAFGLGRGCYCRQNYQSRQQGRRLRRRRHWLITWLVQCSMS